MAKDRPGGQGLFITFEGGDGTGKSTQIKLLLEYFRGAGQAAVVTREPGGTPVGESIRSLLLDPLSAMSYRTEALLYLADRAEHAERVVRPALAAGFHVICDRFSDSTYVYQGVARGLDADALWRINDWAAGGLTPDITFLLDAPPESLSGRRRERGEPDRMEEEGLAFQRTVRSGFLDLAKKDAGRILVIDALQSIDQIQAAIRAYIGNRAQGKE
ncbi:MAG: dTMP kinase [Acidaminococcales bacterium]|jgi:dTMP kinase|nr:dTMP kinase [Acidaminococcales bacterium]